jgi:hypothetical protein
MENLKKVDSQLLKKVLVKKLIKKLKVIKLAAFTAPLKGSMKIQKS